MAFDGANNLYFVENTASLVRRIDRVTGVLSTVAGNYGSGSGYSGDNGPATFAQLNHPLSLAFDRSDNLYIADDSNHSVCKVSSSTGIITTTGGLGPHNRGYSGDGGPATAAALNDPEGLAVHPAGNVHIADSGNLVVRRIDGSTGVITTAVGIYGGPRQVESYTGDGGPAKLAGLSYFEEVVLDGAGNLYIADGTTESFGRSAWRLASHPSVP